MRNLTFLGISFIGRYMHVKRFYLFGEEQNNASSRNVLLIGTYRSDTVACIPSKLIKHLF